MIADQPVDNGPAGRFLGVDLGTRRVGLALSDPTGTIVSPLATLSFTTKVGLLEDLRKTCAEYQVYLVVIGCPVNLDGAPTQLGVRAKRIAATLVTEGVLAIVWDEQFTSREATEIIGRRRRYSNREKNSGRIDRVAAALMLQDYLEWRSGSTR